MAQPSIASYFHSRKRAAGDEIFNAKNKVILIDQQKCDTTTATAATRLKIFDPAANDVVASAEPSTNSDQKLTTASDVATESTGRKTPLVGRPIRRCLKRSAATSEKSTTSNGSTNQPKIVKFTLAGYLSPKKKCIVRGGGGEKKSQSTSSAAAAVALFAAKDASVNIDRGLKTPTKEEQVARATAEKANAARQNLSLAEIKSKIEKSSRLKDLKASMGQLKALEESRQRLLASNKTVRNSKTDKHSFCDQQSDRAARILGKGLKPFETIELDVLGSPQKGFTTPTKLLPPTSPAAGHNELMSPKKTATPRRLFSPSAVTTTTTSGSPTNSPNKSSSYNSLPAFQRFQTLAEAGRPVALQMPYKYRTLAETFKCVDTVCAMFFNRHETITMKKLKPAVQRMLRRNFTESHLAQIQHLYPDAYKFHQKKMLNAGSHTKFDYYQLVVTPNVECSAATTTPAKKLLLNEDDIIRSGQQQTMNPQVMIARQQKFNRALLDIVKDEHDTFLRSLDPPMHIAKEKINRWHPEFDLQNCPEIKCADLPQPPNIEKFSSAKDILSTARNLFNCATPMERCMQRFDEAAAANQQHQLQQSIAQRVGLATSSAALTDTESEPSTPTTLSSATTAAANNDPVSAMLKNVPKSLLERIRAKQAAKALDAMTRRPSQDKEAGRYERLPELARYLRNIFVTESKSVLELDQVLAKLENSYRERIAKDTLKELLELIGKEAPDQWLTFHFIRKTDFVKIKKDVDLNEIIRTLEMRALEVAR